MAQRPADAPRVTDRAAARARAVAGVAARPAVALPLAVLVLAASLLLHVRNAAGPQQPPPFGLFHFADFRDTVWLPARDLLAGNDPYDLRAYLRRNPGAQEFPLYAPGVLVLGVLVAWLPLWAAMALWWVVLVASLAVVGRVALRWARLPVGAAPVALVVALVVLTPPGRQALSAGQVAIPAAAACLVALGSDRRWAAAAAVAVALVKPQVGIPLLGVLLVLGRWRAARDGTALAVLVSLPVAVLLAVRAGGPVAWVRTLVDNLGLSFSSPATSASRSGSTRIDVAGLLSRLGVGLSSTVTLALTLVVLAALLVVLAVVARRHRTTPAVAACTVAGALVLAAPTELYAYVVTVPAVVAGLARLTATGADRRLGLPGLALLVPFVHLATVDELLGLPDLAVLNTAAVVVGSVVLPLALRPARTPGTTEPSPATGMAAPD